MKPRTLAYFCCCLLWLAATPTNVSSGEALLQERIVVHGTGAVEAGPDLAVLRLRISALKPSSQQAMSEVAGMVARVGAVAANLGIKSARIATQTLTLAAQYSKPSSREQKPRNRIGFRAAQSLRIEIPDIERLAPLIDGLSDSEFLQILGLQFVFAQPEELLQEARRRAMKNARARADLYAAEAGVEVGRVLSIVEGGRPGIGGPRPLARAAAALPPGQRRLAAAVTVTYAIRHSGDRPAK